MLERMLVILLALLFHQGYCMDQNSEETFSKFYNCYFAKYFNIPVGQSLPQLEDLVNTTVKKFMAEGEKTPTQDCLLWICDKNLQWKRTITEELEIWAYYAEEGRLVDSWEGCYQDEVEELGDSGYSIHEAGRVVILIQEHLELNTIIYIWKNFQ